MYVLLFILNLLYRLAGDYCECINTAHFHGCWCSTIHYKVGSYLHVIVALIAVVSNTIMNTYSQYVIYCNYNSYC